MWVFKYIFRPVHDFLTNQVLHTKSEFTELLTFNLHIEWALRTLYAYTRQLHFVLECAALYILPGKAAAIYPGYMRAETRV